MSVTGVGEPESTRPGAATTFTCWVTGAIFKSIRTAVTRSERTDTVSAVLLNPLDSALIVYSPTGTVRKVNSPSLSVSAVFDKDEDFEASVTFAPAMGRCCGSITVPRTSPNTEADAFAAQR